MRTIKGAVGPGRGRPPEAAPADEEWVAGPGFAVSATAMHHLPGQAFAALTGRVRWTDAGLQEIADAHGHGRALAEAYARHGLGCLEVLRGQYACCIVDEKAGKTHLVLDRLGLHSLYYTVAGDTLCFAQSTDELAALAGGPFELDRQGLYNYVYFHMVPSPGSVFKGVSKLVGGHVLTFQEGRVELSRYWQPEFSEADASVEDLKDEMLAIIEGSVGRYAGAENVGAFLSGGLDSSTVAGMMARTGQGPARTYSIGFPEEKYNELGYARIVARHFGTRQREYEMTPADALEAIPRIAGYYGEPFGNSSALPVYFCAKIAREDGVDLMLAGDGGDELFAGNTRYFGQRVFEAYHRVPESVRRGVLEPLFFKRPWSDSFILFRKASRYIEQARVPLPDRLDSYNFLHRHAPGEVFTADFLAAVDVDRPLEEVRHTWATPRDATTLNRMLFLDWKRTLQDNDLVKVNYMCEMAGVDVAYPLLDDDLVEFSCRVPSRLKLKGTRVRHFYKEAVADFLPREVIQKKKHGFGLPFGVWTYSHAPLQDLAYGALRDLKKRGIFRDEFLDQAIHMHRNEHAAYYGELVWILMMLELWLAAHGH